MNQTPVTDAQSLSAAYAAALGETTYMIVSDATAAAMATPTSRTKRAARTVYGTYNDLARATAAYMADKVFFPVGKDARGRPQSAFRYRGKLVEVRGNDVTIIA